MVRDGVEGSVDLLKDVPSMLVVIVATFLFLMTVTESIMTYTAFQDEKALADEMESFCDSVLSFEPLLHESIYGQLDSTKLTRKTADKFHDTFNPHVMGFHYNITLLDVGLYVNRYNWFAGEVIKDEGSVRRTSVPANVRTESGQVHPAILKVMIWR